MSGFKVMVGSVSATNVYWTREGRQSTVRGFRNVETHISSAIVWPCYDPKALLPLWDGPLSTARDSQQ